MSKQNTLDTNLNIKFDEKIKELEESLPKGTPDANCSALTLTHTLNVLGNPEFNSFYFNNLAIPLGGGYGGFKSIKGWKPPCGAVSGGCMAIGIIMGGQERLDFKDHMKTYQKTANFVHLFEKEFGSVACHDLCGTDFNDISQINEYMKKDIWGKKCYKFVVFAVDQIRKIMASELKKKWQ